MAIRLVERRLEKIVSRLVSLRAELGVIDEQLRHLGDDADDQALRALVAETAAANHEALNARRHLDAMRRHRQHVVEKIAELERRQDELLDELTTR